MILLPKKKKNRQYFNNRLKKRTSTMLSSLFLIYHSCRYSLWNMLAEACALGVIIKSFIHTWSGIVAT